MPENYKPSLETALVDAKIYSEKLNDLDEVLLHLDLSSFPDDVKLAIVAVSSMLLRKDIYHSLCRKCMHTNSQTVSMSFF
jgi:hypothetical protein